MLKVIRVMRVIRVSRVSRVVSAIRAVRDRLLSRIAGVAILVVPVFQQKQLEEHIRRLG